MKKTKKKSRVSWASDSMLCQVKTFLIEDCPAKVASSNPPPGFEATQYASRRNISHIPRIKWKRPPKFVINDDLRVESGVLSTETSSENFRIAKVLEAFYPHRSVIPTCPSLSPAVEEACYDDSTTPNIRLTPFEDEWEAAVEALCALAKEHGFQVDPDLLVKLLSDAKILQNLLNEMKGKSFETANDDSLNTDITTAMDKNPPPIPANCVPHNVPVSVQSSATDPPLPKPGQPMMKGKSFETANDDSLNNDITNPRHAPSTAMGRNPPPLPGNCVPHNVPVSVQSSATDPPLPKPGQPMSSALSMNLNLQKPTLDVHTYPLSSGIKPLPRLEDSYSCTAAPLKPSPVDNIVVSEQKTQSLNMSTFSTWNMNRIPESAQTEKDTLIRNGTINRDDPVSAKPVKNLDYFKNLIREHGGVNQDTCENNNSKRRADDMKVVKVKIQIPCKFFKRAKGCRLGESCLYLHDGSKRLSPDVAPHFPRAKRRKFGS